MKIGVISDIHSNVIAFRACTKYMEEEGCNEYLFLGDYISDTPYTRETLDYLYDFIKSHTCQLLRGNREEYMLTQQEMRKEEEVPKHLIEELIEAASKAPSAKNRQPWKYLVYSGARKSELLDIMESALDKESETHELLPYSEGGLADAHQIIRRYKLA